MSDYGKILLIGLGSMGYGIAQSLKRSGYEVYGKDINTDQENKFNKVIFFNSIIKKFYV